MSKAPEETLKKAYKPYDIVTDKAGNVGFITEVDINRSQSSFDDQISYSVNWMVGNGTKEAWFKHDELKSHCNMLIKIAEQSCDPFGNNKHNVKDLLQNI